MRKVDTKELRKNISGANSRLSFVSPHLREIYMMLTLECDLRCDFCCWWGPSGPCRDPKFLKEHSPSLGTRDLRRFIDQAAGFRPSVINLSGGEPLLYDGWHALALYIRKKNMKAALTTNGLRLAKEAVKINNAIDELNISFQGSCDSTKKGYMPALKEGLIKLGALNKKQGTGPSIKILYTMTPETIRHLDSFKEFFSDRLMPAANIIFQHFMFIDPSTYEKQREALSQGFGVKEAVFSRGFVFPGAKKGIALLKKCIAALKNEEKTAFAPNLLSSEIGPYYARNKRPSHYSCYCSAPWHQLNLLPNGDLYTCQDLIIGNIKEQPLNHIWNGPKAKRVRQYVSKRLFPACKGCFYHYTDRAR